MRAPVDIPKDHNNFLSLKTTALIAKLSKQEYVGEIATDWRHPDRYREWTQSHQFMYV
jgi:hypothetical protein